MYDESSETVFGPVEPPPRRRLWLYILAIVTAIPAAVMAYLWFFIPPKVPTGPLRMVRNADGLLVDADEQAKGGPLFEAHREAIQAQNNFASASSSSQSDHSRFDCSRLILLNRSEHLLMARVGQSLLEKMKTLDFVTQVDYYPAGFTPPVGERAPDQVITLDMPELTSNGGLTGEELKAHVTVRMGNTAIGSRHSYSDTFSPPIVALDWSGELQHQSTTRGAASSAAKYKMVSEDIAKQIFESIAKEFKERREKNGSAKELPAGFYPPYRQPPALPLDGLGQLKMLSSWHGVMNHNETVWQLVPARPALDVLLDIKRRLQAAGWKTYDAVSKDEYPHLRITHGAAVLEVYVPATSFSVMSKSSPQVLSLRYVDSMTADELHAAVDRALDDGASAEVLLALESFWSDKQAERIMKLFTSQAPRTPQASLALARLYHRCKHDDKSRAELLRARVLMTTIFDSSAIEAGVKDLAKTLKEKPPAEKPLGPEDFRKAGFIEVKPDMSLPPQDVDADELVHFYYQEKDGTWRTVSVRVVRQSLRDFQLNVVETSPGVRSSLGGGHVYTIRTSACMLEIAAAGPDAHGRYRMTFKINKNEKK